MCLRHSVHMQQSVESCREQLLEAPARCLPGSVSPTAEDRRFDVAVGLGGAASLVSELRTFNDLLCTVLHRNDSFKGIALDTFDQGSDALG